MKYCFHCVGKIEDDTARYCPHCGKQCSVHYSNSNELPPNTYLNNGRYFVGKSIGSGGFGITYIGFDTKLDKKIVIKEAFYSGLSNRNTINKENKFPLEVKYDFSSEHETREFVNKVTKKVREECSNLSKAEGLDNIVKVYDWFQENNTAYIILEHIPDVRNLTYEEAVKKLSANDLSAEIKEYQYSDTVAENSVISQTPLNGKISKNSRVLLVISKGSDKSLVKIGSYIGQDIGSVQANLESQGIRVLYRYIYSSAVQGNILSQSVAAGSTVSQGDTISFNVAQKEMYFDTNNFFGNAICSSEISGFEKSNVVQFDGNAWAPNSSSGVGEYLYFDSPIYVKEVTMNGCILDIGCSRSNEDFYNYGRPTKLRFEFSDGYSETVNVSDVMTHQIVYFKKTVTTTSLKVIIESSVGGKIMDNPCISGIATVG